MIPIDRARLIYASEPCARTFAEDLELHFQHGYVVSTPECFAMARPVWKHWSYKELTDPSFTDPGGDCWWIYLLAGDLRTGMRWLPDRREWIGYERLNVPRFFKVSKFPLRSNQLEGTF